MSYKGPDLRNWLVGVLTRFPEDRIAVIIMMFIKILHWQFTIIKIEIEKLKFIIDDKYMAYILKYIILKQ